MARSTAQRVAANEEHRSQTRDFLNLVKAISRREGWREYDVFSKWLTAAGCALANPVLRVLGDQARWDQNEARYMKVVRSCQEAKATMADMSEMLAVIQVALSENPIDFIGPVFMEVAANSNVGQFFTPHHVSELIARMNLMNARDLLSDLYSREGRTFLSIHEPACGVGGMVLASNAVLREQGMDLAQEVHWTCVDIDSHAFWGTFIQLTLTGCSATVVHGDTLRLQEWQSLPTMTALMHPKTCN